MHQSKNNRSLNYCLVFHLKFHWEFCIIEKQLSLHKRIETLKDKKSPFYLFKYAASEKYFGLIRKPGILMMIYDLMVFAVQMKVKIIS